MTIIQLKIKSAKNGKQERNKSYTMTDMIQLNLQPLMEDIGKKSKQDKQTVRVFPQRCENSKSVKSSRKKTELFKITYLVGETHKIRN